MKNAKLSNRYRLALALVGMSCCQMAMAKCGGVDYSWGADGLAKAHDFIITMLLYVLFGQKSTEFNHHLSE
jgi:hypothetical protein